MRPRPFRRSFHLASSQVRSGIFCARCITSTPAIYNTLCQSKVHCFAHATVNTAQDSFAPELTRVQYEATTVVEMIAESYSRPIREGLEYSRGQALPAMLTVEIWRLLV